MRRARKIRPSVETVLSYNAETFGTVPFQCVTNFWYRKSFCLRWKCHDFLAKTFVSQYQNLSWEKPFCLSAKFCCRKKFMDKWGWSEYHNFFCLTAPKNFLKKPSTVALVLGIENFYDKGSYVTISCRFFCLAVPKKFVEELFCAVFQETSVSEKVYG